MSAASSLYNPATSAPLTTQFLGQNLMQGLDLPNAGMVSLCGAGGKTTLMYALAAEAVAKGHAVVCATTTKVFIPRVPEDVRALFLAEDFQEQEGLFDTLRHAKKALAGAWPVFLAGQTLSDNKLGGLLPETLDALHHAFPEYLFLVEVDGAARKAMKAPSAHEPVFPASTALTVAVVGLEAVTGPLDPALVHRPELVSALTGIPVGEKLCVAAMQVLASHEEGWFRGCPDKSRRLIFGNKADTFPVPEGWPWHYGSAAQSWCAQGRGVKSARVKGEGV